jgi:low affinity Fe/Cu permease
MTARPSAKAGNSGAAHPLQERFAHFARTASNIAGKPAAFLVAVAVVVAWAITGPLFGFSDTWQLVINTGTTIVTFLMVFLIQNTQNRDQMAMQIKLAELIVAMKGAHNKLALAEEMSDEELEQLHEHFQSMCEHTHRSLAARRSAPAGEKSKPDGNKAKKKNQKAA